MGLFDSVYAACPSCGTPIEFQSKEGDCSLTNYSVATAPKFVLLDVLNEPHYCRKCGNWSVLYDPAFPPNVETHRPQPTMRKVRRPSPEEFHAHASQDFLRWWDTPFVESDMLDEPAPVAPADRAVSR